MDSTSFARTLSEVADMLEIEGGRSLGIRAYRNSVRTIETQPRPLSKRIAEGDRCHAAAQRRA